MFTIYNKYYKILLFIYKKIHNTFTNLIRSTYAMPNYLRAFIYNYLL